MKYEVTLHRGHRGRGHVEKRVEIVVARDSEDAVEVALENVDGTSWRVEKIEAIG